MALPRNDYAPNRYDYDGDIESEYEDWKNYFDDSDNQVKPVQISTLGIDEMVESCRHTAQNEKRYDGSPWNSTHRAWRSPKSNR